jgi:carbamoyl-phosphate synthase large subunit
LLGFGGQTGLNTGVELAHQGILDKYNVRVLGTSVDSIMATEDRELFNRKLAEIGEPFAKSEAVVTVKAALEAAEKVNYPVIVRAAYALGGLGSGFANNPTELEALASRALSSAPQILVEKSLKGWKEVEYEVVRDAQDNCITVCNMENFDPMGIHTGESIVVAPSQTLSNEEYHMLRTAAIKTVRHLGIVGECNIQYALNPYSLEYSVIEVNPRLSRSSALASKATGYPLAFVAAKIALGIPMHQISNSVTKSTSACFEPSLDYIVTKIPRWDLKKFERVSPLLGSQMKSVGEVMAVGRTFEESLQKALRMVDPSNAGFEAKFDGDMDEELKNPTPNRIFAIAKAMEQGYSVDTIWQLTKIDKWFLEKLKHIVEIRKNIVSVGNVTDIPRELMREAKSAGFSDKQIGKYTKAEELEVRGVRKSMGVVPVVKQIDTLAAEFPAKTNYLYMTYNGQKSDIPEDKGGVMVLGSGTYRIGSSVEFDYCAVSAVRNLRKMGEKTIMVNYNPETVSTDYDESDKLYFEELSLERVMDIHDRESPNGVIVSVGGQQPQNIALPLYKNGVNVLGTNPHKIDQAEDRYKFSKLLDSIGVGQPEWKELSSMDEAKTFSNKVGYPVLIRPSYVLSGAAMNVAANEEELVNYLAMAADVNPDHPVVITKFVLGAREVELDGVACDGTMVNWAISEHIENAGVHSGDATMILPSDTLSQQVKSRVFEMGSKIAKALEISGPCNIQFLVKGDEILVIECNLRASRSFPFVSKTYDIDFIETATKVFMGQKITPNYKCNSDLKYVGVKAPQFSFQRLGGADPVLGVEMASTGEVACFGENKYEAFLKAMTSVPPYFKMPTKQKTVLLSGNVTQEFVKSAQIFVNGGFTLFATPEVAPLLKKNNVKFTELAKPDLASKDANNAITWVTQKKLDLVINFPTRNEDISNYNLRRKSVDFGVPCLTNEQVCAFLAEALTRVKDMPIKNYDDYLATHTMH